jgi:hypothetical protein
LKNLKSLLIKPENDSRLWALWIWNKTISEEEMIKQLSSFIEKGFGGVAIRPSQDICPSYLSEEFLSLLGKTLDFAKTNGIQVRIADDFSVPWCTIFNEELEQNISFRGQYLTLEHSATVLSKESFEYKVSDSSNYFVLCARIEGEKIDTDSIKDLPLNNKSPIITWKAVAGDWKVMVFKKSWMTDSFGNYVPNLFNAKVAQFYLQNVLEKLTVRFEKYIPSTFEGFISELPVYMPRENSIPWDDDLIIKYKSRYKKNLLEMIPPLFFEVDDAYAKYRSHVYNFISQSIFDRFAVILEAWAVKAHFSQWLLCPERDIQWPEYSIAEFMSLPSGADELATVGLQNLEGTEKNYYALKTLADINTIEYKRETLAIIGRNTKGAAASIQSLKTEIDQLVSIGVSRLLLDGCFFNLDHRIYLKTPFNPFWYHPEWDQMRQLCDYAARMISLDRTLTKSYPVAVVLPGPSIIADYMPGDYASLTKGMALFRKVIDMLRERSIEFDVVTDQYLLSCPVKANGEFGIPGKHRKGCYITVIIPYSRLINNSLFVFLEKLVSKKGSVIFINEPPQGNFDDGQSTSFLTRVARLVRPKNETVHVASINDFITRLETIERAAQISVNGKPCPDLQTSTGSAGAYEVSIFHNSSATKYYFATIELSDTQHVYLLDCAEGDVFDLPGFQVVEGKGSIELDFSPRQTYILLSTNTKLMGIDSAKSKTHYVNTIGALNRNYRVVLKDQWAFLPDSLNVLPLSIWNMRIGLSRDFGGFSHFYESYFEIEELPPKCLLVFPGFTLYDSVKSNPLKNMEISINGIIVKPLQKDPAETVKLETDLFLEQYLGAHTLKYNIKETLMKGINRVSIRSVGIYNGPGSVTYPPILAGFFSIKKGPKGWIVDTLETQANNDSWTKHGFPYLSGSGIYQQNFEIPSEYNRIILRIPNISGKVFTELNEKQLGLYIWQPVGYDITGIVEPRRNILKIRVSNSLDNIIRMNQRDSGLIGEVFLDIY